jgi:hypothetical protein
MMASTPLRLGKNPLELSPVGLRLVRRDPQPVHRSREHHLPHLRLSRPAVGREMVILFSQVQKM